MIRLGRASVLSDFTEQLLIPRAAPYARTYLAALWDNIMACDPPATLGIDSAVGAGVKLDECLVVEPTGKRLRYYQTLHFAQPENSGLRVGYYLIGGDRAAGGSLFGGETFGVGRPTDADVDNVISIVEMIRDYAVKPTVQHIVDLSQGATRQPGFAGT